MFLGGNTNHNKSIVSLTYVW